ncbi:hypothetical protein ABZ917_18905 [Nonomuraea wenchangensis]
MRVSPASASTWAARSTNSAMVGPCGQSGRTDSTTSLRPLRRVRAGAYGV